MQIGLKQRLELVAYLEVSNGRQDWASRDMVIQILIN